MSQPLLSVNGLMMRFGGLLAVNNVNLELYPQEIVSLIGPNGAGKTTVFNCLTGFYKPTGGTIMLRDQHLEGLPGQQIARCMVTQPEILMLDEPAAGLNPKETKELDELIAELRNHHNTTILLIEHDMKLVMGISDRIYVVNQGTPLANGTPEQIRNNPDVIRAYLGEA